MTKMQNENERMFNEFNKELKETIQISQDNNKKLLEQGQAIQRLADKNEEIFKQIKLSENIQRRMMFNMYCKKLMIRILAVLLTVLNIMVIFGRIFSTNEKSNEE